MSSDSSQDVYGPDCYISGICWGAHLCLCSLLCLVSPPAPASPSPAHVPWERSPDADAIRKPDQPTSRFLPRRDAHSRACESSTAFSDEPGCWQDEHEPERWTAGTTQRAQSFRSRSRSCCAPSFTDTWSSIRPHPRGAWLCMPLAVGISLFELTCVSLPGARASLHRTVTTWCSCPGCPAPREALASGRTARRRGTQRGLVVAPRKASKWPQASARAPLFAATTLRLAILSPPESPHGRAGCECLDGMFDDITA